MLSILSSGLVELCADSGRQGVRYLATPEVAGQFTFELEEGALRVTPRRGVARRRVLRPLGWFDVATVAGEYPELNCFLGRVEFDAGESAARRYRAYSRDDRRTLRAVLLSLERPGGEDVAAAYALFQEFVQSLPRPPRTSADGGQDGAAILDRIQRLSDHAHGWMSVVELLLLDWAARRAGRDGLHVIEIGSYQGRSTAAIAAALADRGLNSLVVSFDPNELWPAQAEIALANVSAVGQRRRLVQVHRGAAEAGGLLADGVACMAFIDGLHEQPYVRQDFQVCDRLLAPGGLLVMHDVYPLAHLGYEPARPAPAQFVEQVILPSGRYRPVAACHLALAMEKRA